MSLRAFAKNLAHRAGAFRAWHASRNAGTLTVVMFHRVLPEEERARSGADPLYTVTPRFLGSCVTFLQEHYAIVGLADVLAARARTRPLPRNAVLITFDDGWHDNLEYAAPVLKSVPWTVFVNCSAMEDPACWWQEVLLWAIRSGAATAKDFAAKAGAKDADSDHALLMLYSALAESERRAILDPYRTALLNRDTKQMMLAPRDLPALEKSGAAIGVHGASHLPLTLLQDPEADLRRARDRVMAWLGTDKVPAMSFPHGRYNENLLKSARDLGYPLMFTSDPVLNRCRGGWLENDVLGRIPVDLHDVADAEGNLAGDRLAAWLFLRDIGPSAKAA